jgi:hypothetical protein
MIYEPSGIGAADIAAAFGADGKIKARQPFDTREAAEAFLQAFMQEKAGEYGLVNTPRPAESSGELAKRRAGVIKSANDEAKRRRLGVHGKKSK